MGLYRLCGSAAVKKELRDAFEKDSAAVTLDEELYPDINVITGERTRARTHTRAHTQLEFLSVMSQSLCLQVF